MAHEDADNPAWQDARMYREQHERLRQATEHVARACAEITRAVSAVGDHASAVGLSAAAEDLQLLQSQLATSAEKAFTLGQLAVRRAQHVDIQRRANDAINGPS